MILLRSFQNYGLPSNSPFIAICPDADDCTRAIYISTEYVFFPIEIYKVYVKENVENNLK